MRIAFVGDAHGRVFHLLTVLHEVAAERGLDLVIQVGDMGVWPDPARIDRPTRFFAEKDPTELDFHRILSPGELRAAFLSRMAERLPAPILFIRGNHEDTAWLQGCTDIDRFGLFRYVPDGTIERREEVSIGFLGGIETGADRADAIDDAAYGRLFELGPGTVDILVTHDAPHGLATGKRGNVQGSPRILRLVQRLQPRFHLFGHLHHVIGPLAVGRTTAVGLSLLVSNIRTEEDRAKQVVQPGSVGLLSTDQWSFELVDEPWLADVERELDLEAVLAKAGSAGGRAK